MTISVSPPSKRRSARALRALAVIGFAASLAGCMTSREVADDHYPNDYRVRHPILLAQGTRTVDVFLGADRGGLTPDQRADVLAFAQSWRHDATGGIIVDVPHGGPTDRAAADTLREIHAIFAASGIPSRAVFVRSYQPDASSLASIKVSFSRLTAHAGPCGLWPHDLGPTTDPAYDENREYWNLGCASQRNLAAMVDNPADLVQPRGETPVYAARRSIALDKYRKGDSPSGSYPSDGGNGYDNGKISDFAK